MYPVIGGELGWNSHKSLEDWVLEELWRPPLAGLYIVVFSLGQTHLLECKPAFTHFIHLLLHSTNVTRYHHILYKSFIFRTKWVTISHLAEIQMENTFYGAFKFFLVASWYAYLRSFDVDILRFCFSMTYLVLFIHGTNLSFHRGQGIWCMFGMLWGFKGFWACVLKTLCISLVCY